jgi:catechol 2,3-dioxygenase-like lactoylglutathione lyase family enzyme
MIKGIDHVVILVKDLAQATADYTSLGFTVVPGGEHVDGASHNALVSFADGSYLELIAFKKESPGHRWWPKTTNPATGGEGLIDFALLPTEIEKDIAAARERGLDYQGPFAGGRQRPDGQAIKWQTGQPVTPDLPFLCGDITPRSLRVPSGPAWHHANGVTGIESVLVLVDTLPNSSRRYQALLGIEPVPLTEGNLSAAKQAGLTRPNFFNLFTLGPSKIILVDLDGPGGELHNLSINTVGEGPLNLRLKATQPVTFDKALTHNVNLSTAR